MNGPDALFLSLSDSPRVFMSEDDAPPIQILVPRRERRPVPLLNGTEVSPLFI